MARTTEDVLVYLAMTKFRPRFFLREFPLRIKHDVLSFFGDLAAEQTWARDLLFAAGNVDEIELAWEGLDLGWQDQGALLRRPFASRPHQDSQALG